MSRGPGELQHLIARAAREQRDKRWTVAELAQYTGRGERQIRQAIASIEKNWSDRFLDVRISRGEIGRKGIGEYGPPGPGPRGSIGGMPVYGLTVSYRR